jgi:DNA-binding NarL/FixJ family response regulator
VGEAADGAAKLEAVARLRPDVVLLDLSMPRLEGMDAIATMRERSPASRIVALSGFMADEMDDAVRERGAHAYVEKGTGAGAIRDAVRAAAGAPDPQARAARRRERASVPAAALPSARERALAAAALRRRR